MISNLEYFTERLKFCSVEDKYYCLGILDHMLEYVVINSIQGMDGVEKALESEVDTFIRIALEMLYVAVDPEEIRDGLYRYIAGGNYFGRDFLEKIVIIETVCVMLRSAMPVHTKRLLCGFWGMDFYDKFWEYHWTHPGEKGRCFLNTKPKCG